MVSELFPDLSSASSIANYFATVGIQAVIFLVTIVVVNKLLLKPLLKLHKLRNEYTVDSEEETKNMKAKSDVLREECEWRVDGARQLANEKRSVAELIGKRRAEMILSEVKRETLRDYDNVVRSSEERYKAIAHTSSQNVSNIAKLIVDKVVE